MKWNWVGLLCFVLFIVIAFSYDTTAGNAIDEWATNTFGGNEFLEALHVIGNTKTIIFLTLAFMVFIIVTKKAWKGALFSLFSVGLGFDLNQLLKPIFQRPRPDIANQLTSYSFPSAHAMGTTICLLTIAFVLNEQFFEKRPKALLYVLAMIISAFVALSRVAGARHFFTDVTAGMSLGVAFVALVEFIYRKMKK